MNSTIDNTYTTSASNVTYVAKQSHRQEVLLDDWAELKNDVEKYKQVPKIYSILASVVFSLFGVFLGIWITTAISKTDPNLFVVSCTILFFCLTVLFYVIDYMKKSNNIKIDFDRIKKSIQRIEKKFTSSGSNSIEGQ